MNVDKFPQEFSIFHPDRAYWENFQSLKSDLYAARNYCDTVQAQWFLSGWGSTGWEAERDLLRRLAEDEGDISAEEAGDIPDDAPGVEGRPHDKNSYRYCIRSPSLLLALSIANVAHLLRPCSRVLNRYCGGIGKSANVIKFYCWLALHDANLGLLAGTLADNGANGKWKPNSPPQSDTPPGRGGSKRRTGYMIAEGLKCLKPSPMPQELTQAIVAEKIAKATESAAMTKLASAQAKSAECGDMERFIALGDAIPPQLQHLRNSAIVALASKIGVPTTP